MIVAIVLLLLACVAPAAGQTFQWTQLPGPPGGYGHLFGEWDGVFFSMAENGKVYRSTDYGTTWSGPIPGINASAGIFAGTGKYFYIATAQGIYRSGDRGVAWGIALGGSLGGEITALAADDAIVVAVVNGVTYSSVNSGTTWTEGPRVAAGDIRPSIAITDSALFVYGVEGAQRLHRSDDSGRSWSPVNPIGITPIAIAGADSILFAITAQAPGIYHSTDKGERWAPDTLDGGYMAVGLKRSTRGVLLFGEDRATEWDSYSKVWRFIRPMKEFGSIAGSGAVYMVGDRLQGLTRFMNGTWERINSPVPRFTIRSLDTLRGRMIAEGDAFFESSDGRNWTEMKSLYPSTLSIQPLNAIVEVEGIIIAALRSMAVRSADGGITWETAVKGIENLRVNDLAVRDTVVFAATFNGIYRSTDRGGSWERKSEGITDNLTWHCLVSGGWVYAATRSQVFRSSDNGESWIAREYGFPYVGPIAATPSRLLMIADGILYHSTDAGEVWRPNYNMPPLAGNGNVSIVTVGSNIMVANHGRVSLSADDGATWSVDEITVDGDPVYITALAWFDSALYVGTNDHGLFRGVSSRLSSVNAPLSRGTAPLLECLPNPASGVVAIRYAVETAGAVELRILDPLGNAVAAIPDAPGEAGTHMVRFDAGGLPSGLYFCRVRIGDRQRIAPVVIRR